MPYVIVGLCLVIVLLLLVCRSLWHASRNEGLYEWIGQLEKQLREQQAVSTDFRCVLARVGELFDGAGVTLARGFAGETARQEAVDLVELGSVLRLWAVRFPVDDDLFGNHRKLDELGDRYGIEPDRHGDIIGCRYSIATMVRIGEEIIGRVLKEPDSAVVRTGH